MSASEKKDPKDLDQPKKKTTELGDLPVSEEEQSNVRGGIAPPKGSPDPPNTTPVCTTGAMSTCRVTTGVESWACTGCK